MRRDELFQMLPLPRKRDRKETDSYNADTCSYFSQMTPRKDAPSYRRRKGASTASKMHRQRSTEESY